MCKCKQSVVNTSNPKHLSLVSVHCQAGGGLGCPARLLQPPIEYLPVPGTVPGTKDQSQLPGRVSDLGGQTDGQAIINVTSTAEGGAMHWDRVSWGPHILHSLYQKSEGELTLGGGRWREVV